MHGFLSNLTAVMLLAHAMLGCCAHHVHACGHAHRQVGSNDGSTACHDHATGYSEGSEGKHQDRDDCRGNRCDMVRPANQAAGKSDPASYQVLGLSLPAVAQASGGRYRVQQLCTFGTVSLPVRIHLANQVLLI